MSYGPADPTNEGFDPSQALHANWVAYPWSAPPTVKWSSYTEEISCLKDRNGDPIRNKAGDPISPPPTRPISTPVAVVTRIEKSFNPLYITLYKDTVNEFEWQGYPAESVLCKEIVGDRVVDPEWGVLWTVSYTFAFRPPVKASNDEVIVAGWDTQVLNAGYYYKRPDGWQSRIVVDGVPASEPVPLDNDGAVLAPAADPVYLAFKTFLTADFDDFNFASDLLTASTV